MNRIAATLAIVLVSAGAAVAQDDYVTRAAPSDLFVSPADLALLPSTGSTVTAGDQVTVRAGDVFNGRDLASTSIDAGETIAATVFETNGSTVSIR